MGKGKDNDNNFDSVGSNVFMQMYILISKTDNVTAHSPPVVYAKRNSSGPASLGRCTMKLIVPFFPLLICCLYALFPKREETKCTKRTTEHRTVLPDSKIWDL